MKKSSRSSAILLAAAIAFCGACHAESKSTGPLELRISAPDRAFVQGEPVPIRVEITNRSDKVVQVTEALEPEYLMLRFRVTDPKGRTYVPEPFVAASSESSEVALGPGDKLTYTSVLLFGLVNDIQRFIFDKTGKYRVEALYSYYDVHGTGGIITSEPVTIRVIQPDGVDGQAQRLFVGLEQGRLACGAGTNRAAVGSFHEILRKYPTSRFAPYAAYYLGLHYLNQRDYKQGTELLEGILADYKEFPLKAELSYRLAIRYYETGRKGEAKKLLTGLTAKEPSDLFARRAERLLRELQF